MTRRLKNGGVIIEATEPDICELCGNKAELRPYGPGGKNICYPCGKKNAADTERRMGEFMEGKT